MATDEEVRDAVVRAKALLEGDGRSCRTTPQELKEWFEADTPLEDIGLDGVLANPLLVVHELVEIEEVLKMGLTIGKTTIVDNLEKVDEAHLIATELELRIAFALGNADHIRGRMDNMRTWIGDPTVTPEHKKVCARLLDDAGEMTRKLSRPGHQR